MHHIKATQFLPITLEDAWVFFSAPKNLSKISPPEMDFVIKSTSVNQEIYTGMLIDYTVKPLFGLKMKWQTEITEVEKPFKFTDTQRKGPYKIWEHTHSFSAVEGGVMMTDIVHYKAPFGVLGEMMNAIIIRKKVTDIFAYREKVLEKLFVKNG